jgi:hypothetical protein
MGGGGGGGGGRADEQTWSQKRLALQPYFSLLCSSEMTFSAVCAQPARCTYGVSKISLLLTNLLLPVICALYVMLPLTGTALVTTITAKQRNERILICLMTISVDAHSREHQILGAKPLFKRFDVSLTVHHSIDLFQ